MGEPRQTPSPVPFPRSETRRWAPLFREELGKRKTRGSCGSSPCCPQGSHPLPAVVQETQRPPARPGPTSGPALEARRRPWLRG